MRRLRRVAAVGVLALIGLLVVLGRTAASDPAVELTRALRKAGYADASVVVLRAEGDGGHVVIEYDPQGQPAAAVAELSQRAADLAWTSGGISIATVSVRPAGGPVLDLPASALVAAGSPPADRQGYSEIHNRARWVVIGAGVAVLLTVLLVLCATAAAVVVARRRTRRGDAARTAR